MIEDVRNAVVRATLSLPRPVLALLAGPPVVIDGQTLDIQLQVLLQMMAKARQPLLQDLPLDVGRRLFIQSAAVLAGDVPVMSRVERRDIDGPHGSIPLHIYVPRVGRSPHPVVVYYHGGGWVIGGPDSHEQVARRIAEQAEAIVVFVDYRLAPENKFPCAAEEALAAFRWIAANAAGFGGDPSRIAVAGDSAGGNLAAVVALETTRAGERAPDFQLLIYPVTDVSRDSRSYELFADGFYLTRSLMHWFRDHYLPDSSCGGDPRVSPLHAPDLSGLPPAFVMTAGFDVLRDEGRAYAERLAEAGVRVEYRNHASMIHGFASMAGGVIAEATAAMEDATGALRKALHGAR
ncbi:MAG TPA: alpha/beta hydrolase [Candidatus Limnocylindrales bacterium]|nr:alpha/beta hydrolase [Candidatus Limnocylindrales bacterium]